MLRTRILPRYLSITNRSPLCFVPISSRRITICNVITATCPDGPGSHDDDDYDDDEEPNFNVDSEHIKTIRNLNKLYYYDYTITYEDLKDLIVGTFKKLYRVKMEVREKQICFVIYPEIKSEHDLDYKNEMNDIALLLSDYAMKEYLYHEIKKIDMIKKDVIVIPLKIGLDRN